MKTSFSFKVPKSRSSIVIVLAIILFLIWGAGFAVAYYLFRESVVDTVRSSRASAQFLSKLILEHQRAALGIIQSYAQRPLLIDTIKRKDLKGVIRHIKPLAERSPEQDLVLVTDKNANVLTAYPVHQESHGKNVSHLDWYQGVCKQWKPYVSGVYMRVIGGKDLAVAICAPVFDEKGNVVGILGTSQRTFFLARLVSEVKLDPESEITLLDGAGRIIFSDKFPYQNEITDYEPFAFLKAAFRKRKIDTQIRDSSQGGRTKYVSFAPIEELGWSVVVEHGRIEIFRALLSSFILIGVVSFLLCITVVLGFSNFINKYNHLSEVRLLSHRILTAHEKERKRIAGDIHDSLSSSLAQVKFKVEGIIGKIGEKGGPEVRESLQAIVSVIQESMDECRRLQLDLRPAILDDLGILATLSWFCRRFKTNYPGISIEQKNDIKEDEVPHLVKTSIFRITQEAMNNIVKHSKADLIVLSLKVEGKKIELTIKDNGSGFDVEEALSQERSLRGLGLESMKERTELSGGVFRVESAKGNGTTVRASWSC